jgi:Ca2+-binding RTX toxin-like protein
LAAALLAASWGAAPSVGAEPAAPDGSDRAGPTVDRFPGWAAGERYGTAVAIDFAVPGRDYSFAAVSAPWGSAPGQPDHSGRVDIYTDYVAGDVRAWHWTGESLPLPAPKAYAEFGISLDLTDDGDLLVVGEPYGDWCAANRGAVHLYTRSGGAFSYSTTLCGTDSAAGDRFGQAVSVSGDGSLIAVGAPSHASGAGAVYAFIADGGGWTSTKLTPDDLVAGECLGAAVAASRDAAMPAGYLDAVMAGAPCSEPLPEGGAKGRMVLFTRQVGGTDPFDWTDESLGSAYGDTRLGSAVALSGDDAAGFVGVPGSEVVVQRPSGSGPSISPPIPAPEFGAAIDATPANLMAGAPGAGDGGSAFWFIPGSEGWIPAQWFRSSDDTDHRYGAAVAIGPDTAVIGAPGPEGAASAGAVEFVDLEVGADLWVDLYVDDPLMAVDTEEAFEITLGNDGPADAKNIVVEFGPFSILEFVSATGAGYYDPDDGYWLVAELPAGGTASVIVRMRAAEVASAELTVELLAATPNDTDSIPQNGVEGEDDLDREPIEIVTVLCDGEQPTILGTDGAETIHGTEGHDVIHGLGGDDIIIGYAGDDVVCGGDGDDLLKGGPGHDILRGGPGNDKIRGAAGDDWLYGEDGSDRLLPEAGNDHVSGGAGSDIVDYLAALGPVVVDLEAGTGTYADPDLAPGQTWQHAVSVEKVDGTRYADILKGDWKRNVLRGKQGNDEISGFDGDDDLIGGTGTDTILGGAGDDLVKGQADDDVLRGEGGADKVVGGAGNDTLRGGMGDDLLIGGLRSHLGVFVNSLNGGDGTDTCRWEALTVDCEP